MEDTTSKPQSQETDGKSDSNAGPHEDHKPDEDADKTQENENDDKKGKTSTEQTDASKDDPPSTEGVPGNNKATQVDTDGVTQTASGITSDKKVKKSAQTESSTITTGDAESTSVPLEHNEEQEPEVLVDETMRDTGHTNIEKKDSYEELLDKIRNLEEKNNTLQEEANDNAERLSKLMGENMRANNPSVVDLSDVNRPTKLAEYYGELYDNEWTHAYDEFEKETGKGTVNPRNETRFINNLRDILTECYTFCQYISGNQKNVITRALTKPGSFTTAENEDQLPDIQKTTDKNVDTADKEHGALQRNHDTGLADLRKSCYGISVNNVIETFKSSDIAEDMFKKPDSARYTTRCLELCWIMCLQSPPVYLQIAKPGDQFDKSIYNEYTERGDLVDFVVWPAMFLFEGGAMLRKGVAQGKAK